MITNAQNWQRPLLDQNADIENQVRQMLFDIASDGDSKIRELSEQFDRQPPQFIQLKPFADYQLDSQLADAIKLAAQRIESFARFQRSGIDSKQFADEFGSFGQVVSPINRVGAYIPGGRFPLISTALMTLIPAKVAGCPVRIACSPSAHPAVLAAASLASATQFIQLGGVQAIAALAQGYETIEPVDLIVGPGNAWVNEAKKQLQSRVKIDGLAGPSELLALCDDKQPIEWLALDALAQAEHDPLACSLIVSDSRNWLDSLLAYLTSNQNTQKLLEQRQIELIYAQSVNELITFSETYAPEHLMLCHQQIKAEQLNHYGSLFVGANSAVALGDYITGPNHTLPTLGYARQTGGLNINTYLKICTIQQLNDHGRQQLSEAAMPLALAEGLTFHYESLKARTSK
ncbi:histidinol dehydrogenase [Aliikangiella sp. IMCC44359]|uniref:histidinol dehydrogenase n=1 Tax=Aliikangiella sp. IMCC44359 TaxID=3459125 RepID=UPI00403A86F6